jgi:hypothetical protein
MNACLVTCRLIQLEVLCWKRDDGTSTPRESDGKVTINIYFCSKHVTMMSTTHDVLETFSSTKIHGHMSTGLSEFPTVMSSHEKGWT